MLTRWFLPDIYCIPEREKTDTDLERRGDTSERERLKTSATSSTEIVRHSSVLLKLQQRSTTRPGRPGP